MNPFGNSSKRISDSYPVQFVRRPVVYVTALCLLCGLTFAAWRIRVRTTEVQARARAQALAVSTRIELQFNQAVSAVEVLQALARPGEPVFPDFPKVASDLLESRPSVAALELLPGGVVRDAIPRAGNQRALGYNILKDPAHRLAVNSAMQKRALAVAGPLRLWDGAPGIRVLVPLFQKGRDGREVFWGFVAGSMRLSEVFARAGLQELGRLGYDYALMATVPATQTPVRLAESGSLARGTALQQPIQVRNLEFTLALRPRGGWLDVAGMMARLGGVIIASGLLCACLILWRKRAEAGAALFAANSQYAQEVTRSGALEQRLRTASERVAAGEAELKRVRGALEQAEAFVAELRSRVEHAEQETRQASEAAEAREKQFESRVHDFQSQVEILRETGRKDAQAAEIERQRLESELERARQTVAKQGERLETAAQEKKQMAAAALAQQRQLQAALADVESRLDSSSRTAADAAATNSARLDRLRDENRELKAALQAAETRAEELSARLEETRAELVRRAETLREPALSQPASTETPVKEEPSADLTKDLPEALEDERSQRDHNRQMVDLADETLAPVEERPLASEPQPDEPNQQAEAAPELTEEPPGLAAVLSAEIPASDAPAATDTLLASGPDKPEPPPVNKAPRAPRSRKARRDDQMDLFSAPVAAEAPAREIAAPEPELPAAGADAVEAADEAEQAEEHDLAAEPGEPSTPEMAAEPEDRSGAKPHRATPVHHARPLSAEETVELRKAVHQIVPLLADQDPGARDCLKDNRATFRSAFSPEGFDHFQQLVKTGDFTAGLEQLRKAVKRHGISA